MMKNIINSIFAILIVFSFTACDDEYELGDIAPNDDARVIKASIDVRYVDWKDQRSFYDHDNNTITVQMLTGSFKGSKSASAMIIYVTPVIFATMSPFGGVEEDWSSGQRQYTITSGDGSTTNVYTIKLEEVASF